MWWIGLCRRVGVIFQTTIRHTFVDCCIVWSWQGLSKGTANWFAWIEDEWWRRYPVLDYNLPSTGTDRWWAVSRKYRAGSICWSSGLGSDEQCIRALGRHAAIVQKMQLLVDRSADIWSDGRRFSARVHSRIWQIRVAVLSIMTGFLNSSVACAWYTFEFGQFGRPGIITSIAQLTARFPLQSVCVWSLRVSQSQICRMSLGMSLMMSRSHSCKESQGQIDQHSWYSWREGRRRRQGKPGWAKWKVSLENCVSKSFNGTFLYLQK